MAAAHACSSAAAAGEAPTTGEHRMGTTIVGVCYDGGVVLGADSRTSTGMYVANRASDKITQLTDNVYVCRSGSVSAHAIFKIEAFSLLFSHAVNEHGKGRAQFLGISSRFFFCPGRAYIDGWKKAADTQVISDYVRYFLHQHTIQLGQPATVKVASNLIRLLAYQNKNMLQAGMIVGGWDKYEGGQIFSVPLGGTILRQPFAIGGSGSSYLYALLDHEWKEGMSQEEAEKFVVKVVSLAMARDGASGGVVRTVTINADGVKRNFYPGDKLPLWHEEMEPQNSFLDILAARSPDPMVQ
ncbi:Proteasome subunit beta type-6 [Dichanthelium oligosanthes]|uniref:Proteasome subunit beta type-6 n=1 Tax=Dichanthelium oligosanthes TaxID=888268 RepID=A0A1E5URA5_9POAL|nr:Proteasome subunit beta type-6 [Dichanthelium oligosanthes]